MSLLSSYPAFPAYRQKAFFLAFALCVLAPLVYGGLALFLGQDANWDFRNYHWYNAYAFLTGRYAVDLLPSQLPYFYNPLLDVPFYLLSTAVGAKVAGFALAVVQGLNFVLLFMIAHATLAISNAQKKVLLCAIIAALGVTGAGAFAQIGTTFYDNITSFGFLGGALLILVSMETLYQGRFARAAVLSVLAGIPAGLMMGFKLPSVIFCVGLCAALFMTTGTLKRRFWLSFWFGIGVLSGLAISFSYWGHYLWQTYDNPFFPYFNEIFQSSYFPPTSMRDVKFIQEGLIGKLLFPFSFSASPKLTGEVDWTDFRLLVWYVLLPIGALSCLAFGRKTVRPDRLAAPYAARFLQWAAVATYGVWLIVFSIYRYAVPLEMLMPLLIVLALGLFPMPRRTRGLVAVCLLLAIVFGEKPADWGRKTPWMEKSVEASVPVIDKTDNLMIFMTGCEPYAHLVSLFPPEIPFVRIQSNFASPDEEKGINAMLSERINAHKDKGGVFKVIVVGWQEEAAKIALSYFGFTFLPQTCQKIDDKLFETKLSLCDVKEEAP